MKETAYWRKMRLGAVLNFVVVSAWFALDLQPANAIEPAQPVAAPPATSASAPQKDPGMKIFVDPKTGKISKPAPQLELPEASQKSLEITKEPSPELFEAPSPRPGGGVMIDLKGQFRSPLKATRDAEGKLSIKHEPGTSAAMEKK
jgi:hypothetical protein